MPSRTLDLAGFLDLEDFLDAAPANTRKAASLALNATIGGPRGLGVYKKALAREINFPGDYLNDSRIRFDKRATPDSLSASILARQRPTSLARFVTSAAVPGRAGVTVQVKANGGSKFFKGGFLVRLKGAEGGDGNLGLAVRLGPNTRLNKRDTSKMVHLDANVVLLYGPSIDQVLQQSVADAETPEVVDNVATEFFRQFERLNR